MDVGRAISLFTWYEARTVSCCPATEHEQLLFSTVPSVLHPEAALVITHQNVVLDFSFFLGPFLVLFSSSRIGRTIRIVVDFVKFVDPAEA